MSNPVAGAPDLRIWWPAQRAGSETVMMTKAPSPLDSDFALEQICGSQRPWMLSQKSGANYSLARVNRLAIHSNILLTLLAKKRSHWRTRGGRGYGDMGDPNRTGRQIHSIFAFSTNKVSPFVS